MVIAGQGHQPAHTSVSELIKARLARWWVAEGLGALTEGKNRIPITKGSLMEPRRRLATVTQCQICRSVLFRDSAAYGSCGLGGAHRGWCAPCNRRRAPMRGRDNKT
jgi:hypothetical protein